MFKKVLIANRGAIACRIIRTLRRMGVGSVAVYSTADRNSLHVLQADEAILLGDAPASASYLSFDAIFAACAQTGAEAIHPGYGFLSENIAFARECAARGIVFIGPSPEHIDAFALKHTARATAQSCNVPLLPGTGLLSSLEEALTQADTLKYPVMLKSSGGGGGIGMKVCHAAEELREAYDTVIRLAQSNFGNSAVYLEKFVSRARHIEVQIFGDGKGGVLTLGERDCSAQRRHQKVLEETPAPGLTDATREQLYASAKVLAQAVHYANAGTVEFIYDETTSDFYFLEVNTRLQVEHGVTEEVTGVDLVEWMVLQAAGEMPPLTSFTIKPTGASMEARIYAEDPAKGFQPAPGKLTQVTFPGPEDARAGSPRIETWIESGTTITSFYDPMIAKVIVKGSTREEALARLSAALDAIALDGTETNLRYLREIVRTPAFTSGTITTAFLGTFVPTRNAIEVLEGGTQTTVQDYPGRIGYWNVGVPPSGPMDHLSFRIANRLVGNPEGTTAIEFATMGGRLKFHANSVIAFTGADMSARLDGKPIPLWTAIPIEPGSTLSLGAASKEGIRAYLSVQGGFDTQPYLGSRSTFVLGGFGGPAGRALRAGDTLHIGQPGITPGTPAVLPAALAPQLTHDWTIGVLLGPHTAPDFFTAEDIAMIFSAEGEGWGEGWKVHYQSDRTGVRLIGPKPKWARTDGGEAGLHPSNIHDNAYAIGTIDFTGDMPILLGPDGPSLGGFVCPGTIVQAELWKLGQLKAGDRVHFRPITLAQAQQMEREQDVFLASLTSSSLPTDLSSRPESAPFADVAERPASGTTANPSSRPESASFANTNSSSRPESASFATADLSSRPERSEVERPASGTTTNLSSRPESAPFADVAERPASLPQLPDSPTPEPAILRTLTDRPTRMVFRADGDKYLLVEYGDLQLDLHLRFRVHILEQHLREAILAGQVPGILDITPGVRSLHIHYDSRILQRAHLIDTLANIDAALPPLTDITVPSRIVHLPLSWDDPQAVLAQQKYMQAVRPDAPWCPSNIEFIRRINGLDSIDDVYRIVHEASYLVLGLGDVYLGAPVATPVDPRHRLVTTKYNPARTWTPENAVGIGGAYMCVYGMEGPGGYQLVGRTIQVWNTWKSTPAFAPGTPWSLRFFDQIRFYPVTAAELLEARENFPHGRFELKIEDSTFNLADYDRFLASIAPEAAAFKQYQKASFDAERERWAAAGLLTPPDAPEDTTEAAVITIPEGCEGVSSPLTASVFQIPVTLGQPVAEGEKLIILDAMKTEIGITSHLAGTVEAIYCELGALVNAGQLLFAIRPT